MSSHGQSHSGGQSGRRKGPEPNESDAAAFRRRQAGLGPGDRLRWTRRRGRLAHAAGPARTEARAAPGFRNEVNELSWVTRPSVEDEARHRAVINGAEEDDSVHGFDRFQLNTSYTQD